MTIKNRLDKLEQHVPARPVLVFKQDLDHRDLWHEPGAGIWQDADTLTLYAGDVLDDLEAYYNLVLMTWEQDWRPATGHRQINLTWGDEE
jgi:hypothetical protein